MSETIIRLITLTSPLGTDVLQPVAFRATEALSEPFAFAVEMYSTTATIDPDTMLFQPICITLQYNDAELAPRSFHGIVRSFGGSGARSDSTYAYTAEIVPRLWFLMQTVDCRIWQNMTAIDVVKSVFADLSITPVTYSISGTPPTRETITQFNETDYDFVVRLLEEEGCFYYFTHSASDHTLVIADDKSSFTALAQGDSMTVEDSGARGYFSIAGWHHLKTTVTGQINMLDYDLTVPGTLPTGQAKTVLTTSGAANRDSFVWPALALKSDAAATRATQRMDAAESAAVMVEGAGTQFNFIPGGIFTIASDPFDGTSNASFVVRAVTHIATDGDQRSGGASASYSNSFTAFPAATKWRPVPSIAKPRMVGVHTALVIGPSGQEILTDKYGRIQVQFYWDHRAEAKPQSDICWVRVIQPWSGTVTGENWGWHHLPRIGTEVAVSFMDGDPDRPVVLGCFYNGVAMPIFDLSSRDNWTKTGFRSRSATSAAAGGSANYSEFSFDDKTGSELIFLHAEKDYVGEVENNQTLTVQNDQTITVQHDRFLSVTNNESIDIGKTETVTIGSGRSTTIKDKDEELTVTTGDITVTTSAGKMVTTSNTDYTVTAKTGNILEEASLGNITIKADVGGITIQATTSITLKCGTSSLTIDPSGITLKGMNMTIKGDLATDVEGLMTTVKGNAMLTLKGAITMLN